MKNNRNFSAFSLIEISIVILIVGILIAGVTQSSRLVSQAKINSAQTLTQSSPASSVKNMSLWIESTLDESFDAAEADEGLTITNWYDINPQVSSKSHFRQETTASRPTYRANSLNGLPTINFSSASGATVGRFMTALNFSNIITNATTVFAVVNMPATLADQVIFGKRPVDGGGANIQINTLSAVKAVGFCDNSSTGTGLGLACITPTNNPPVIANRPYILSVVYTGNTPSSATTSTGVTFFHNGSALSTASQAISSNLSTTVTAPLMLGNSGTALSENFAGNIGEIIVYDRALKREERQSIETYLGKKWGIRMVAAAF